MNKCCIKIISYTIQIICWLIFLINQAKPQKLHFEHLNIHNGLSQNDVLTIKQDSKGYIWFGTLDGLNKYDGYQFINYQREPFKKGSLTMNAVTGIWETSDGTLWIHPVNSDLQKFDPSTETFSVFNPVSTGKFQFDPRLMQDLEEDAEGMMWAHNEEGQLCRFDKIDGKIIGDDYSKMILNNPYNKANPTKSINDLFKDKEGNVWIGSSEGLHKIKFTSHGNGQSSTISFENYWYNPKDTNGIMQVNKILEDNNGKFWWSGAGKLNCFDIKTHQIIKYGSESNNKNSLNDIYISGIAEDARENLWIATHNGLYKLDPARKNFTRFFHDSSDATSLSGNSIWSFIIDKSNTIWIGTLNDGINKVNLNYYSFPLYQHNPFDPNSLSNNKVTAICEDKEGIVWVGTLEGGLNGWNRVTGKFTHYRHGTDNAESLFGDAVGAILEDHNGDLWIGSNRSGSVAVSKLNRETNQFENHILNYPSISKYYTAIFTMYEDKSGLIWIGTGNGIVTFDPAKNQSHHYPYENKVDGLSDPWIFSFCEDREGNMWIGTSTERLNKLYKKTGKFKHYSYEQKDPKSISSKTARCIFKDSKGTLWFGTFGGGLCRFNPADESFTAFTKKQGLPSNTIHSIQEDDEGNLWLGTGNGLSRFSLKDRSVINYDDKDGLQSNQFTMGHNSPGASFKGKDGTLYFGGINGFNAFNPKDLKRNQYIPPIVINQFTLFDKRVPGLNTTKEIRLKYDENFFSFEFAALDYANSQKNQYAYKLEGVDNDWVYCGSNRVARYTNVPFGQYIFHVKGTNSDGVWNENGITKAVIISPPWWRTDLAYVFYLLLIILILFAIHRFQRKRVLQKERERNREKELRQAKEIEKAYHKLKKTQTQLIQSEKMASLGELTAGIAHEIQNPLNFVNNFSEVNRELISELVEEVDKENYGEVKLIANDIKENEEKINHHGKRADAIVKGMLQHSKSSTGVKELIDINKLTDEYLRLAYHGMRAKDKEFNAEIKTDFDESIGKINVVPQDIGRVLLNLFNNAFYVVNEKFTANRSPLTADYKPTVSVQTKKINGKVEIIVSDNGNGIPQNIVDKIFQPFFTTKPTGQGTGLGLSLAYDIIKAHEGEIKVETREGEGSVFVIQLPYNP